jgi:hypothetical protein
VYVDGVQFGHVRELRSIPADEVERIQFMSATDATIRFGLGHLAGAILVFTRRGARLS